MTTHIDKFGRTWNYTPDHDTGRMLQIDPAIMLAAYNFQAVIRTQDAEFQGAHAKGWPVDPVDCYLLRMSNEWCAGIRCSDKNSDYISPCFDARVVAFMIEHHSYRMNGREADAFYAIVTKPRLGLI